MKQNYIFEYLNENEFKKKERSIRKYNMLAYKKLTFDFYPTIRSGNFLGQLVSVSKKSFKIPVISKTLMALASEVISFIFIDSYCGNSI